jgi:hypothetical protein
MWPAVLVQRCSMMSHSCRQHAVEPSKQEC